MRREIEAELEMRYRPRALEEVHASILTKLEAIESRRTDEQLAAGWTKSPDGHWVPPGYAPIPGWTPPPDAAMAPPYDEADGDPASTGSSAAPGSRRAHSSDPPDSV